MEVNSNSNNLNYSDPNKSVMTLGEWLITLVIFMVPCVNIIMYFVWAFGNGNENRKNFCRASLIITAVSVVLCFVFGASLFTALLAAAGSM